MSDAATPPTDEELHAMLAWLDPEDPAAVRRTTAAATPRQVFGVILPSL